MKEIRLHYSEALLRAAVRSFVWHAVVRQLGLKFLLAIGVVIATMAYLLSSNDHGWFIGFALAVILFVGVFITAIYVAHFRNTVGRFRQMRTPEATLSGDEKQFTLSSELGSATMPWSAITEVWRYPRFWLLLFSRSQFVTLPTDDLDEEARAFITRKTSSEQS